MRNTIAKLIVEQNDLPITIEGDGREVVGDGVYKVEWSNGEEGEITFTLWSSGAWDYEGLGNAVDGNSIPPHSKRWFSSLMKRGYPAEISKAICVEWMSLKLQADGSKRR